MAAQSQAGAGEPTSRFNFQYTRLKVEENLKDPQTRNKVKICGAISFLILMVLMLVVAGSNRGDDDSVGDPDLFEQMLESGASIGEDIATDDDPDEEDVKSLPRSCGSRRKEHPGTASGARIQYVHIPGTGGTSIERAMMNWDHGTVFKKADVPPSNKECPPAAGNYFLLAGPRGFGYCGDIAESARGLLVFTAIREPIARAVSLFDAERAAMGPFFKRVFGTRPLSDWLKEFNRTSKVEEGEAFLRFMGSQQARFLCGYDCFAPKNKTVNQEAVLLSRAKENLRALDAVAVSERLNELIPQLKLHLRWLPVGFKAWPKLNKFQGEHSALDEDALAILKEYSKSDIEIHKAADSLAAKRFKAAQQCLAKDVRLRR